MGWNKYRKTPDEFGGTKAEPGYAGDGLSQHTRRMSSGGEPAGEKVGRKFIDERLLTIADLPKSEQRGLTRLDRVILKNMRELERIEAKLIIETDPERAGKLALAQEIKMRFIERLRAEQREQAK